MAAGNREDELVALVALVRSHLYGADELSAAADYYGSAVTTLEHVRRGDLQPGAQRSLGTLDADVVAAARRDVAEWMHGGLDVRSMLDDTYPPNLLSVHNKPSWVFIEGTFDPEHDSRAVAVVGTRSASKGGIQRAHHLARSLAEAGVTVVSGMARGIDTAAHLATLRAGGRTIAVMGTGIRRRYPKENARLAHAIVDAGSCLVSSFLPDQPPTKWTFPVRNVVMSGMCKATIVVEAGATSGARMQAEAALLHGRSVFLPRSLVEAHTWAQRLVEQGKHGSTAVMVESTDDIVSRLDLKFDDAEPLVA